MEYLQRYYYSYQLNPLESDVILKSLDGIYGRLCLHIYPELYGETKVYAFAEKESRDIKMIQRNL